MNDVNVNHGSVARFKVDIGYAVNIRFVLFENGIDAVTTGWTWQLIIKRFPGDRKNIISLTLNNGLTYEIYSDTVLIAKLTAAQTLIEEGEYYIALIRTDLPRKVIEGKAIFSYANPDI